MDDKGFSLFAHAEAIVLGFSILLGLMFWAVFRNSNLVKAQSWDFPEDA
ncbi:MAG: hypothetical protein JJU11_04635 [Candidatus Sumerlaeia bacterium]|nr:hypothetical protein [Candidatus Sumerlaeia bacterium]